MTDLTRSEDRCPFCRVTTADSLMSTGQAVALLDRFPISAGHVLVVPRRHVASLFDLPDDIQDEVWRLVALVRGELRERYRPEAFTVGLNDGNAAGQTIPHAHVHVIPRYSGDVADPRGGIRWVIPARAAYWEKEY